MGCSMNHACITVDTPAHACNSVDMAASVADVAHKGEAIEKSVESPGKACGICLEKAPMCLMGSTRCCQQYMCQHCFMSDQAYKAAPTCPFCRQQCYELSKEQDDGVPIMPSATMSNLEGVWDVRIVETSKVGSSTYHAELIIDGKAACYAVGDNHLAGGSWDKLTFGHTPSGKTFVAKQMIKQVPSWCAGTASILCPEGLQGRLNGPDCASFTTSMTLVCNRSDEELEVVQKGEMVRKSERLGSWAR